MPFNPTSAQILVDNQKYFNSSNSVLGALNLTVDSLTEKHCVASVDLKSSFCIPGRSIVHGGIVAILSDHVVGLVFYPLTSEGSWVATQGLSITYLEPTKFTETSKLIAEATVTYLKGSNGICIVNCYVEDQGKKVQVSSAQGTVRIISKPKL